MGATLADVEVAALDVVEPHVWAGGWRATARRPPVLDGSDGLAVDCGVCGGTHPPGTADDPRCRD